MCFHKRLNSSFYINCCHIFHELRAKIKIEVYNVHPLGKSITSNVVWPQVLKENSLDLEGQKLEIIGLEEFPSKTFVWIPSIKAVVGGINVFGTSFHVWMADAQTQEARKQWLSVLEKIVSLQPIIVVPAHGKSETAFDLTPVNHTINYIEFYDALKTNKTSEALIAAIKAKYPALTFDIALQIGAKVNTGEIKW
jgi:hypothetical protein